MKVNPPAGSVLILRIAVVLLHEYAGLRHAEPVNALLDITDHETAALPRILP